MSKLIGLRLFEAYDPPPAELEKARQKLTRDACPRRYCWFWHSLQFDWGLNSAEGCQVAEQHPQQLIMERDGAEVPPWRQCCRATGNAQQPDYFEPRERYLEADGWTPDYFVAAGKENRRTRHARRKRGKKGNDRR
jgi:hypothetical protein